MSVHIHKNGGMQLKNFFLKSFGDKLLLESGKDNEVLRRFFSGGDNKRPSKKEYDNFEIVHGHFLANRFDDFDNVQLITFLREPAQRVLSNYYFFKRNFYNHSPICHMIKDGLTLEEYVDLESSKNVQSFFLAGKSIEDFSFIGILEEYEESISLLKKILNIKFNAKNECFFYKKYFESIISKDNSKIMTFNKISTNKNIYKNGKDYDIPVSLFNKIKDNNLLDYDIYYKAKNKFNRIKDEYDI